MVTKMKRVKMPADSKSGPPPAVSTQLRVPIDRIFARNNPREHFDQDALKQLAESIRQNDVIEPLVIRPADAQGRYELLAGERRLRAAKMARLKDVPVVVRNCDEAQAAKIRLIENFVREDLNALEEAKAFQQITAAGVTQQELADELKLTQAHISNRIRLLELPAAWQERLVAREITASQARALVPWAGRDGVLDFVAAYLVDRKECHSADEPPTLAEFERKIAHAVAQCTKPMKPQSWEGEPFTPTADELASLDVVELKDGTRTYSRAFNVELWQRIQERVKAKKAEREARKAERDQAASETLSPAEQKRKAEEARKKMEARLFLWRTRWYQERIQAEIDGADTHQLFRCLLFFACGDKPGNRGAELGRVIADFGGECSQKKRGYLSTPDIWSALKTVDDAKLDALVAAVLAVWWHHDTDGWGHDVSADEIEAFAGELGIGLKKDWRIDRSFLELFTKDQLHELAAEWAITSHKAWIAGKKEKRGDLIDTILAVDEALTGGAILNTGNKKRLPAPACLLEAGRG